VIKAYNPSPALIERAAELGVVALAEDVFGKWQRHRIATNRLPLDFEAAEADFENWIRDQAGRRGPQRSPERSDPIHAMWRRAVEAREEEERAERARGGVG
jgi:hypothetical protein